MEQLGDSPVTESKVPPIEPLTAEEAFTAENLALHKRRYRKDQDGKEEKDFDELYANKTWEDDHYHLIDELDVIRLRIDAKAQAIIHRLQAALVDQPCDKWGKTQSYTKFGKVWEGYTLMFRNGWNSDGDKRKPVTEEFQRYCEEIYCPIIWSMLYGEDWEEIKPHWSTFKSCTIKVCENTSFYGQDIFHMHIDGKIGILEEKNYAQKHMTRLLFSVVTDTLITNYNSGEAKLDADDANDKDQDNDDTCGHYIVDEKVQKEYQRRADLLKNRTTAYPVWQPHQGFGNNHQFHDYMQSLYKDRGLENSGLARPHYEIPESITYKAKTGEVLFHRTHSDPAYGPQPIHSEPNPCPDRHLYVFDWNNIINKDPKSGKYLPSVEVPEDLIVDSMEPLADSASDEFKERLQHVSQTMTDLLESADKYQSGRETLEMLIKELTLLL